MRRVLLLNIIFVFVLFSDMYGQSDYFGSKTRSVSYEGENGEFSFTIFTDKSDQKTITKLEYYWYDRGKLHITTGNFSGYLLNGQFIHYHKITNEILEKGILVNGLKSGAWMNWSVEGVLNSVINWKKGQKQGFETIYNKMGMIISKSKYKNGQLNGWKYTYYEDTLKSKLKYKNGIIYTGGVLGIKNTRFYKKIFSNDKIKEPGSKEKAIKEKE